MRSNTRLWIGGLFILAIGMTVPPFLIPIIINTCFGVELDGDSINPGTFGDQYGALNALFSGLAFLVIFISLKTQQDELKTQNKAIASQELANEIQNFTLHFQFITTQLKEKFNSVSGEFHNDDGNGKKTSTLDQYFSDLYLEMMVISGDVKANTLAMIRNSDNVKLLNDYDINTDEFHAGYRANDVRDNRYGRLLFDAVFQKRISEVGQFNMAYFTCFNYLRSSYQRLVAKLPVNDQTARSDFDFLFLTYVDFFASMFEVTTHTWFLYSLLRAEPNFKSDMVSQRVFLTIRDAVYLDPEHEKQAFPERFDAQGNRIP